MKMKKIEMLFSFVLLRSGFQTDLDFKDFFQVIVPEHRFKK